VLVEARGFYVYIGKRDEEGKEGHEECDGEEEGDSPEAGFLSYFGF